MKRVDEPSNATGMPMIGPRNAITLQSSKTNLLDGTEIFLLEPCWKAFRRASTGRCAQAARTVSAQTGVGMVRHTPKACIGAINAIKSNQAMRSFFSIALTCFEDHRGHESAGTSLDQETRRKQEARLSDDS
ncbi:hypothetical protein [Caballeronia sp. LZ035]|uniref:hypothetical protein n=1 Tax=Caballeronia sp. LZ035 TaxID=3038568 RepID=UPI00285E60C7|nr:hypothetical protein [Caballeronia sp. LZ035]MDR5761179.1 hypothetical protein [Caballeronia sp. LZ035]